MTLPPSPIEATATWERTVWRGEPAWQSRRGSVAAIVSEARARLIYLGADDGSHNLLNAPWPQVLPTTDHPWPNQGGHRFWLGPQHRWVWPPPTEWEYAAARLARAKGGVLVVNHEHRDASYPVLTREYAWERSRLRCTVRWMDDGRRYFGLHVVAVDAPCAIETRLDPRPEAPAGFVAARMIDPEPPVKVPHPVLAIDRGIATVRSGIARVKLGFCVQPLTVGRPGGWTLRVLPGPCAEATTELPDHGYLSQVWVGEGGCELAELEQLTPHLRGDPSGSCSSTIFIEAAPPKR
ncbi:MAG: hypothetical protein IAE82_12330 [Opitutaceae bacterium]|nr:hypothetical protein [Opitutaceae bacterium]